MIHIIGGRRSGKTTKLIELSIKLNAYILVSDHNRAVDIKRMAEKMGYPQLLFPITIQEFFNHRNSGYVKNLLIDDGDDIIAHMALRQGWNPAAMTITKNVESWIDLDELVGG